MKIIAPLTFPLLIRRSAMYSRPIDPTEAEVIHHVTLPTQPLVTTSDTDLVAKGET